MGGPVQVHAQRCGKTGQRGQGWVCPPWARGALMALLIVSSSDTARAQDADLPPAVEVPQDAVDAPVAPPETAPAGPVSPPPEPTPPTAANAPPAAPVSVVTPARPVPAVAAAVALVGLIQLVGLLPILPASIAGAAFLFTQLWTGSAASACLACYTPCVWPWVYTGLACAPALLTAPLAAWPVQQVLRKVAHRRTPLVPMVLAGTAVMLPLWAVTSAWNVVGTWMGCALGTCVTSSLAERLIEDGWQRQVATYYATRRYAAPLAALVLFGVPAVGVCCMLSGVPVASAAMLGTGWLLGRPEAEALQDGGADLFRVPGLAEPEETPDEEALPEPLDHDEEDFDWNG